MDDARAHAVIAAPPRRGGRRDGEEVPPVTATGGRTLVLGLGNELLADDAVGLLVARDVAGRVAAGELGPDAGGRCAVRETAAAGLALLDEMMGFDAAIIVDAIQTGREAPGHVFEFDGADLPVLRPAGPHFVGLGETMALGRQLGLPMPEWTAVVAVEVADALTVGGGLTPAVAGAVAVAGDKALALLRHFCCCGPIHVRTSEPCPTS